MVWLYPIQTSPVDIVSSQWLCPSKLESLVYSLPESRQYARLENNLIQAGILKDGNIITTKKGNKYYLELLDKMSNVLSDYTIEKEDGTKVNTNEKRIYAPNIVAVVDGNAKELTEGISSKENDPYMKLTNSMNNESKKQIKCILKCLEETNVCTSKTSC